MMAAERESVLVWAPNGRDGALIVALLERHRIMTRQCDSLEVLVRSLSEAGCAVIAQEALTREDLAVIEEALLEQPAWSDFPFIMLAIKPLQGKSASSAWRALGNVTLLEGPTRSRSLLTAVGAALRARRRQYEAEQAILHRDQFLAMLGHELRNPLAAIALAMEAERARRGRGAAAGTGSSDIVVRQVRHLTRLVDGLLDVARVTTGKVVLNPVVVDLNLVLERCVQSQEMSARASDIEIVCIPSATPVFVHGDVVRLEEILSSLLVNAIKYSSPGSRVEASVARVEQAGLLTVRDNGIGIDRELLPRVFDLFTQAEVSLDRSRGGLGIGLTIVKSLVELHGGSVGAESDGPGRGSTFSVKLPLLPVSMEPSAPSSQLLGNAPLAVSVLLVDDNPDLLEMTKEVLEGFGCEVAVAQDGPSGLERLMELSPALAFIDIGLPGIDGYQLARKARSARSQGPWLIALTGYGQREDRERALAAGFDQHLTKPVSIATLRRAVEEASATRPKQPSE